MTERDVITFGKYKGMRIKDVPRLELTNYVTGLKRLKVSPFIRDFLDGVDEYLSLGGERDINRERMPGTS